MLLKINSVVDLLVKRSFFIPFPRFFLVFLGETVSLKPRGASQLDFLIPRLLLLHQDLENNCKVECVLPIVVVSILPQRGKSALIGVRNNQSPGHSQSAITVKKHFCIPLHCMLYQTILSVCWDTHPGRSRKRVNCNKLFR